MADYTKPYGRKFRAKMVQRMSGPAGESVTPSSPGTKCQASGIDPDASPSIGKLVASPPRARSRLAV